MKKRFIAIILTAFILCAMPLAAAADDNPYHKLLDQYDLLKNTDEISDKDNPELFIIEGYAAHTSDKLYLFAPSDAKNEFKEIEVNDYRANADVREILSFTLNGTSATVNLTACIDTENNTIFFVDENNTPYKEDFNTAKIKDADKAVYIFFNSSEGTGETDTTISINGQDISSGDFYIQNIKSSASAHVLEYQEIALDVYNNVPVETTDTPVDKEVTTVAKDDTAFDKGDDSVVKDGTPIVKGNVPVAEDDTAEEKGSSKLPLIIGFVIGLAVGFAAAYFIFGKKSGSDKPTPPTAENSGSAAQNNPQAGSQAPAKSKAPSSGKGKPSSKTKGKTTSTESTPTPKKPASTYAPYIDGISSIPVAEPEEMSFTTTAKVSSAATTVQQVDFSFNRPGEEPKKASDSISEFAKSAASTQATAKPTTNDPAIHEMIMRVFKGEIQPFSLNLPSPAQPIGVKNSYDLDVTPSAVPTFTKTGDVNNAPYMLINNQFVYINYNQFNGEDFKIYTDNLKFVERCFDVVDSYGKPVKASNQPIKAITPAVVIVSNDYFTLVQKGKIVV